MLALHREMSEFSNDLVIGNWVETINEIVVGFALTYRTIAAMSKNAFSNSPTSLHPPLAD